MKLENKINKYIKEARQSTNYVDLQHFLKKLNECKKKLLKELNQNAFIFENISQNYNYLEYIKNKYTINKLYLDFDMDNKKITFHNLDFKILK